MKAQLRLGDTIRVVGERGTAKIRAILTSMHGALLENQIGGFRNWNLDELRLVKRSQRKPTVNPESAGMKRNKHPFNLQK